MKLVGKIFLIMFLFIVTGCGEKELLFTKDEIVKGKGERGSFREGGNPQNKVYER